MKIAYCRNYNYDCPRCQAFPSIYMEIPAHRVQRKLAASPSRKEVDKMNEDYLKRAPRENAYFAIDSERAYQDQKYGVQDVNPTGDVMLIVAHAKRLAEPHAIDKQPELVREIAALCVRYMEQNGATMRHPSPKWE